MCLSSGDSEKPPSALEANSVRTSKNVGTRGLQTFEKQIERHYGGVT
jgi:hypothetical protein